ncbi:MAG: transposase [Alphaproteobacteria bacterium]|nr:transposase [Alphaproteobacteria bacterium]
MARLARAVAPGVPHHITQRGNRRQQVFFNAEDYAAYVANLAARCRAEGVEVLAYCLMPNHVHLILVPPHEDALSAVLSRLHRDYARRINFRAGWRGFLWQGRFASFAMDDDYLLACARYVELNPVRARLVVHPADWPWSSAAAHLCGKADHLVRPGAWMARAGDWATHLAAPSGIGEDDAFRASTSTGRPLGSSTFVAKLEAELGRRLGRRKPGPKPKTAESVQAELF